MIYEERRTLAHEKSAGDYLQYCHTELWPKLKSEGGQPLCLLSGLIGDPPNQYLQVIEFEDAQAWAAAQNSVSPSPHDLVASESVRLLKSIASRPKGRSAQGRPAGGVRLSAVLD